MNPAPPVTRIVVMLKLRPPKRFIGQVAGRF